MVWWYFHSCAILNFTDGVPRRKLLMLAAKSPCFSIYILLCFLRSSVSLSLCLWTLSCVKRLTRSWACSIHVHMVCIDLACPVTSSYPSSYLWHLEDVPRDSPWRLDAVVDYICERTVSWCRLCITPYTIQIGIVNCISEALQTYIYIYIDRYTQLGMGTQFNCLALSARQQGVT